MKPQINTNKHGGKIFQKSVSVCVCLWLISSVLFLSACSELEKPKTEPFYAETAPPPKKEFRWTNGKTPKSFDPAKASAPPETDVVRAVFEGLTETEPKTLEAIPAIAADWKSSEDLKTWTFGLRKNARWSNGERVTANDFVRSWKRLAEMNEKIAHPELTRNIVGFQTAKTGALPVVGNVTIDILPKFPANNNNLPILQAPPLLQKETNANSGVVQPPKSVETNTNGAPPALTDKEREETPFGVEATDDFTLKVSLLTPDKDFPALVAHPIFRPVYGDGKAFETEKLNAAVVTNGAFRITSVGPDGITLDRDENYWNREAVELERVKLIPTENAEKALAAYRAGEIDAVTNADFEPLALKLLATYEDFQRTPHAAVNFYEFNRKIAPFDDRRVREALATAIERERISEDEMDGASKPAFSFLPFEDEKAKIVQDVQKAKALLAESGFADGENFPTVRLLVNRNNMQQRIARLVAKMWKQNLNVETEIVVKETGEVEAAWESDEFDLVRRGVVLPTANEMMNMKAIFTAEIESSTEKSLAENGENIASEENRNADVSVPASEQPKAKDEDGILPNVNAEAAEQNETILTDESAISEIPAIPLYFPTSYSLVKPYVQGFDINSLDAPLLKNVRIDNNWQPKTPKKES